MAWTSPAMTEWSCRGHGRSTLQPDLAQIDALAELRLDRLPGPAGHLDLDGVGAGAFVELVELEIPVVVARRLRPRLAGLQEPDFRALDAIDGAALLGRQRAADEAGRIAPEIAVVDARQGAELGLHHRKPLVARDPVHLGVVDLDGPHGAGRAGLLAAGLLPALIDQMRVERPGLRQPELLVPPDVAVGAGVDQLLLPLGLERIDDHDAVGALGDGAVLGGLDAGRVVAVVAHGRHIGDVDHRRLAALLLQDVDPLVAVARHRRRIARPVVADIFVHGGEGAQLAVGALGHVDDHIPFGHYVLSGRCRVYADLCCRHRPRKRTIQYSPTICGARCGTNDRLRVLDAPLSRGMTTVFFPHFARTRLAAFRDSFTCRSLSIWAKAPDTCSTRRSHTSIWTSQLAPGSEWVVLVWVRSVVSRFRQPPRSTEGPGSPVGS